MKKKILIIGKKSFIGANLNIYLSKFFSVKKISFNQAIKKKKEYFLNYNYLINTTIHPNYIKKKYKKIYDLDRILSEKIFNTHVKYFFFNSRKIYKPRIGISEKAKLQPLDVYSKNKIVTECFLIKKLNKNFISLRVSNIIGKRIFKRNRRSHKIFIDNFIDLKKNGKKIIVKNEFKDFITIDYLCLVVKLIIIKNITGVYNVSLFKKVYLSEITKWLNFKIFKKMVFISSNDDSFTLNNKKLVRLIKAQINKKQLKNFCMKIQL